MARATARTIVEMMKMIATTSHLLVDFDDSIGAGDGQGVGTAQETLSLGMRFVHIAQC